MHVPIQVDFLTYILYIYIERKMYGLVNFTCKRSHNWVLIAS